MKPEIFDRFSKNTQMKFFMKIHVVRAEFVLVNRRWEVQTNGDIMRLIVALRNFLTHLITVLTLMPHVSVKMYHLQEIQLPTAYDTTGYEICKYYFTRFLIFEHVLPVDIILFQKLVTVVSLLSLCT